MMRLRQLPWLLSTPIRLNQHWPVGIRLLSTATDKAETPDFASRSGWLRASSTNTFCVKPVGRDTRNYCGQLNQHQQTRRFSALAARPTKYQPFLDNGRSSGGMPAAHQQRRMVSMQEITKNLHLVTQTPRDVAHDPKTLRLEKPSDRPLVVMLSWLMAKKKPLLKYSEIYTEMGFDVLTVQITPWQLLWPVTGSHVVTADVVSFMEHNHQKTPILIHGFSVGAYVWAECLVHFSRDTQRYGSVLDRICGQVWDSAADITEIPIGFPKAVFPNQARLQRTLSNYIQYHMRRFHEVATQHYIRASQMFHHNIVRTPALMFVSHDDPVGSVSSNDSVRQDWLALDIECTWKCWDHSEHVCHYMRHKEEYRETLFAHLEHIGLVTSATGQPEAVRMRAKL